MPVQSKLARARQSPTVLALPLLFALYYARKRFLAAALAQKRKSASSPSSPPPHKLTLPRTQRQPMSSSRLLSSNSLNVTYTPRSSFLLCIAP